jgi:ubiquinol-cytochrome c reductase cytochrome b subunit
MHLLNPQNNFCDTDELKWNQWLAGVIDGDGYLTIQKNNVAICEITMPLQDESLLYQIKQKLSGNIKLRSGSRSVRYRLGHKQGMVELIHRVNGFIRNTIRIIQFQKICHHFNIVYIKAKPLMIDTGYIAGFFDADGTICMRVTKTSKEDSIKAGVFGKIQRLINARGYHQIEVSIANKYLENLVPLEKAFGFGKIRNVGKKPYQTCIYEIGLKHIPKFIDYTKKYPLRSSKKKRLFLLKTYFELKSLKAYLAAENTPLHKAWVKFCYAWYNYDFLTNISDKSNN